MGEEGEGRSSAGSRGGMLTRPNLRTLDLKALPKEEDGPPSETQLRRQKYQFFEKQCSEVLPGALFLSGDYVAKNRDLVRQHGITHVLNCVGFICKEYFKGELEYRTYYLQGGAAGGAALGAHMRMGRLHGHGRGLGVLQGRWGRGRARARRACACALPPSLRSKRASACTHARSRMAQARMHGRGAAPRAANGRPAPPAAAQLRPPPPRAEA